MRKQRTHPFEVHRLHSLIHTLHDARHIPSNLSHSDRCFDSACNSVDARGETKEVEIFRFLPDSVRGVYTSTVVVPLLKRLCRFQRPGQIQWITVRKGSTHLL